MIVSKLRCDYMENPVGFDFDRPSLSWLTKAEGTDKRQSAYRLQVCLSPEFPSPLFDSGKVESDQSVGLRLEAALSPYTRYFWRVKVWDEQDAESGWSEPAFFETARYGAPWAGEWIGMAGDGFPQLRRAFRLDKPVRRARAYACGVGLYCLFLNGRRVGEDVLAPHINAYDQWLQYQTYDITDLLAKGENALGAFLGNGYYKGRVNWPGIPIRTQLYGDRLGLICEVVVEYEDGAREIIASDERWKVAESPFLRSEIYDGEYFDARRIQAGWNAPGFDDAAWAHAVRIEPPKGALEARRSVPLKVMETRPCEKVIVTPAGETVLDFGQNMTGWVRFRTNAPAGTEILLQAGEYLDKHGNFYRDNMRTALAEQRYICRGGGEEYAPYMSFMGFRYIRLTGWAGEVTPGDFTAEVVYSQMERTGWFECSHDKVNRLFLNALWGQKGNFVDVPTDCPQRDERMGWTGDAQVFCATACMNMEADAFYRKYLYDLKKEQSKHGYVPVVIPFFIYGSGRWDFPTAAWGDAATIIPWDLYLYYGDKATLENQFDSMKAWVDYMASQDTLGVDRYYGFHLGDWLAQDTADPFSLFGATPTDLIATAYYAHSARLVAKAARVLGKAEEAERYEALYRRVRNAFRKEYMTGGGRVLSETQTAQAIALYFGLCDDSERAVIARHLAERIRADKNLLTTGFVGTPYLCPALSENGLNEYAYHLLLSTGRPSWLYAVDRGATTIWERWNGIDENGDFGPVSMNSFNHYAYGAIAEWMYRYAAGINPVEDAPGFKRAKIAPLPNDQLSFARASIRTPHGILSSGWRYEGGLLTVEVEVPFNAQAEILLPYAENTSVTENGVPVRGTAFTRGSGAWTYVYKPRQDALCRRIPKDTLPPF
ncbi:MAG: family 78 glycoside hydrolase catalytic domain [Christensenellaceae bacterium]|nr:family 78 glycoside hydrolase catalytic domain [Christensenellaceae bacterium]MEA5065381.1 family 78 glycoside hydrolase catalytic domain [Eubacteriales bacterium]MEA5068809.1 family 78 glycoside hydrolase catalytic domain [Christensenellaceae bacterium]